MKIHVCAPVAERAWILPRWIECLEQQTIKPDGFCFVYSQSGDDTLEILQGLPERGFETHIYETKLPFYSRDQRQGDRSDPNRTAHFSKLRNQLRHLYLTLDTMHPADIFVSLDTDILLEDPTALARLAATASEGLRWQVACAKTCLHPWGERSHCYNAGFWGPGDRGSFIRQWVRAEQYHATRKSPIKIDIPMACYAMQRWWLGHCGGYKTHEQGEDIGFADNLERVGAKVAWLTDLSVRHVWGPQWLDGDPETAHVA